jgi:hypothetical protein
VTTLVTINRWDVWRVIDMPGLARIELDEHRATLVFETQPGCDPSPPEFIAREVASMGRPGIGLPVLAVALGDKDSPS